MNHLSTSLTFGEEFGINTDIFDTNIINLALFHIHNFRFPQKEDGQEVKIQTILMGAVLMAKFETQK